MDYHLTFTFARIFAQLDSLSTYSKYSIQIHLEIKYFAGFTGLLKCNYINANPTSIADKVIKLTKQSQIEITVRLADKRGLQILKEKVDSVRYPVGDERNYIDDSKEILKSILK